MIPPPFAQGHEFGQREAGHCCHLESLDRAFLAAHQAKRRATAHPALRFSVLALSLRAGLLSAWVPPKM